MAFGTAGWLARTSCLAAAASALLAVADARASFIANLSASPNPAAPGQIIHFDGSGSIENDPGRSLTSYFYDFGDGSTVLSSTPSIVDHAYSLFGLYSATLRITNDLLQTNTRAIAVNVSLGNHAPVAFSGGPYSITVGGNLSLAGSATDADLPAGDSIASAAWDLNHDGTYDVSGLTPTISDALLQALNPATPSGPFSVTLKVTDSFGATGTSATLITRSEAVADPEPGTLLLVGLGALGTAAARRRHARAATRA